MDSVRRNIPCTYEFGPYRLSAAERTLQTGGRLIQLTPKVFDTLLVMVERRGQLLRKDELIELLWPETYVEERNLAQNVFLLRKALGDGEQGQRYIQTVPKSGYRFIAEVSEVCADCWAAGGEKSTQPHLQAIKSLAVLPFKTIDAGTAESRLGLGMTDIVITKLSHLQQLTVRPTSAVFKYSDKDYDSLAAGQALQVDAVLDGTVQRTEDRVRLSLRLIRVDDGKTLWSGIFDEPSKDLFKLQDAIAERVAHALSRSLNSEERVQMAKRSTESVEAYEAYVRGLYFWHKQLLDTLNKSAGYFKEAIRKDPGYSLAYAGLADTYALTALETSDPLLIDQMMEEARTMVVKAKGLDAGLPEAYAAHFLIKYYYDKDLGGAELELRRALELNRAYGTAYLRYGVFLRDQGDLQKARAQFLLSLRLEPLSWVGLVGMSEVLLYAGEYEQALKYCEKAVEIEPHLHVGPLHIAWIYILQHRYEEAIGLLLKLQRQFKTPLNFHGDLGYAYARAGHQGKAMQELSKLRRRSGTLKQIRLALIYVGLGDNDRAFQHLAVKDTAEEHRANLLRFDPRLAPLRSDPRYKELLS